MFGNLGISSQPLLVVLILLTPALFLLAISQKWSSTSPPTERDFDSALADWAARRGLRYAPQVAHVIRGVYNGRWFAIGTLNQQDVLQIRMSIRNPRGNGLRIFGDWLEATDAISFLDRFRIYSSPSGLSQRLFSRGMRLRDALLQFPRLRARIELSSSSGDPNHVDYSLLTDFPGADTLETLMASMQRFCEAYEQAIAGVDRIGD